MNSCSNAEGKQVLSYHKHKRRQNYSTYDIKLLLRLKMKQEGFSLPLWIYEYNIWYDKDRVATIKWLQSDQLDR